MHNLPRADGTHWKACQRRRVLFNREMAVDPLAMDGGKVACHQIKDVGLGSGGSFSGHYVIEMTG